MLKIQMAVGVVKESKGTARTPEEVFKECSDMSQMAQEAVVVLTLNAKNRIVGKHMVSLGLADSSLVHPREVFRSAILDGASSIILVHNHPSGDVQVSSEDLRITRQIKEAGTIIGINLLDHIIIGRGEKPFCSLRENGYVAF